MPIKPDNPPPEKPRCFSIRLPRPLWVGLAGFVLLVGAIGLRLGLPIYRQQAAKVALKQRGAYIESDYHGPTWLGERPKMIDGREEEWETNRWRKLFYDATFITTGNSDDFSDRDLRLVEFMPALKRVDLSYSAVTDAGLAYLSRLTRLESLDLTGTKIGDAGLVHLACLPRLRSLRLDETNVTDAGLVRLTQFRCLKSLSLACEGITDAGLRQIAAIPTLKRLELGYTNEVSITDAGLEHLKGMKNLRTVYFNAWGITEAGIEGLRRALPGLKMLDANDDEWYEE